MVVTDILGGGVLRSPPTSFARRSRRPKKLPKCDGGHGFPCAVLAIPTQLIKGDAMKKIIWALAFVITTGVALTAAFGFGLIPLGF
jgi:hypothetical protein